MSKTRMTDAEDYRFDKGVPILEKHSVPIKKHSIGSIGRIQIYETPQPSSDVLFVRF